jgi:uncharacterized ferredoxin-like protein
MMNDSLRGEIMLIKHEEAEKEAVMDVARLMVAAARTAPKGCGVDNIETLIVTGDHKDQLIAELKTISEETGEDFYRRDGENLKSSECVVFIGVKNNPILLDNCGDCGFANCGEMKKVGANCAFNVVDLGIAVGSAVSVAADHRIDNRVFFSAGKAAKRLGFMSSDVRVCYGIPLSTYGKSIYYDRIQQEI